MAHDQRLSSAYSALLRLAPAQRGDFGGMGKWYISDLWEHVSKRPEWHGSVLADFKRWTAEQHRLGTLTLCRADLPSLYDARKLQQSQIQYGAGAAHWDLVDGNDARMLAILRQFRASAPTEKAWRVR